MVKKSYNPFLMIGSYAGVILAILGFHILPNALIPHLSVAPILDYSFQYYFFQVLSYLRTASFGFLLGWGINSLVIFYKK